MLIQASDVTFGYNGRPVVRVDTFDLHPGQCTGIFGANGAGKSTLVRGLTGLLPPLSGAVKRRDNLRIAYVPQHRDMEQHWPMTALDAAAMATSARRRFGWMGGGANRVRQLLSDMGVSDLANKPFATLSGGQQQRVLLAGSLATDPQLLVLDEPTEGLDVRSRSLLLGIVRDCVQRGLGAAMISHDVEDLLFLCPQVAWLHPADEHGAPTRVEMTSAAELARRVTTIGVST